MTMNLRLASSWALLPLLGGQAACGDGNGPDLHGAAYFTASVNGAVWQPDTVVALLWGSPCDTTLLVSGVRSAGSHGEEITVDVRLFHGPTTVTLADTSTGAFGVFSTYPLPVSQAIQSFWTTSAATGQLRITGLTTDDSLISGSFSFSAQTIPDTAPHRTIVAQFRTRYTFQPVFTVGCSP
jgi:hypothetical protein